MLAIVMILTQMALPATVLGRERGHVQTQAAPPDLQITQVKALPRLKDKSITEVEIRWTATVPHLTTLDEFDVVLEVHYSDGSRGVARNHRLKSTVRAILLPLATHPRSNTTAVLKDFKASVNVRFRIASSFAIVHQVVASQGTSAHVSSGSSSPNQPEVFIKAARLVTQGCAAGDQCVDVKWTAAAPRNTAITDFTAIVEALDRDGTQTTDSKTVGGQRRQARLQAGRANVEVSSMKVSLLTSFSLLGSKTAVREGTFSVDTFRG
jgi:hypothetical protein